MKQIPFEKVNWQHRFSHGGILRKQRAGRGARPLSTREPLHLVLKAHREVIGHGLRSPKRFALIQFILKKYAKKFFVKVEQVSVQGDYLHLLVRATRRSSFQSFFRVLSGQIAQRFQQEGLLTVTGTSAAGFETGTVNGKEPSNDAKLDKSRKSPGEVKLRLWKYRPFSRVIRGWKAYKTAKAYVQLNEQEAQGKIPYRKQRLRGLSNDEWSLLWA